MFACSGADGFFQPFQLAATLDDYSLFTGSLPNLYPLARATDQCACRRCWSIRIRLGCSCFVSDADAHEQVTNVKTRRGAFGGASQARYQRHCDSYYLLHMKEVVAALDRVVRAEALDYIVVAVDETARPFLMERLRSISRKR